jgi:hypothetical protein
MELQDFVTSTLQQIVAGVSAAMQADGQGRIAPKIGHGEDDPTILRRFPGWDGVFLVEFDVAVTASEATSKGGGGGIAVLSVLSVKGEAKRDVETSSVSRIKFSVPVTYEPMKPLHAIQSGGV